MQSIPVASRPLMVYAFDPSQGRSLGNFMTINVPYEELKPGPSGPYIEVIDYDTTNQRYYQAVNLDERAILLQGGLYPSESDPRFHQQMVYALYDTMIRTGGYIYRSQIDPVVKPSGDGPAVVYEMKRSNPLIDLARQFGESMGRRSALRSALGTPPNSHALESATEAHDRGAV